MKNNLLLILVLCIFLLTGCKKYDTIEEYAHAMKEVRAKLNSYTMEIDVSTNNIDEHYIAYINGHNWKTEKVDDNKNFQDGILYDGKEVWTYSKSKTSAVQVPFRLMLAMQGINLKKTNDTVMKIINPIGVLVNWSFNEMTGYIDENAWDFGKKKKYNGYKCRMIENLDNDDIVCVSDKYGVAVYAKIKDDKTNTIMEYNVKNISNAPLTEKDLDIPDGIKKLSISGIFQDLMN